MKYSYEVLNMSSVTCEDCGWHVQARNVQPIAKTHAEKRGHYVRGELAVLFSYDGREK